MIKLIVTDVDGTLVDEGTQNLNKRYFEVIDKFIEKNVKFMVASGRHHNSIRTLFEPVKDKILFTAMNGGYISYQDEIIKISTIEKEYILEILKLSKSIDGIFVLLADKDIDYMDNKDKAEFISHNYKGKIEYVDNLEELDFDNLKITKITFISDDDIIDKINVVKEKFGSKLNIVVSGKKSADIMTLGVSKGSAIQNIMQKYGIKKEEVICFGDQENDLSMFEAVGQSFAVEGAIPLLKDKATYIIKSCKEDGVLEVLEEILHTNKYND